VKRTHKGALLDILAKNMRRLRAERGLSQEALAHDCRIDRTYLSSVERSERNVSIDNVARIAAALGVEAWILLKDDKWAQWQRSAGLGVWALARDMFACSRLARDRV
jgi:transcriptional regulator with XRE-family HTH domain